jgi:hypothetical protein
VVFMAQQYHWNGIYHTAAPLFRVEFRARMPLPDDVRDAALRKVQQFCEDRLPEDARTQMRLEVAVRGSSITLIERRAPWNDKFGGDWTSQSIAELRYHRKTGTWSLYWPRATGRWHRYEDLGPASDVRPLLAEIHADPDGVFWG